MSIKFYMTAAAIMFFIAAPAVAAPDPDAETGLEALRKGNVAEAKARFESAVKRDPSNYDAVFFYMSAMPAKDALRTADSLSRSDSPPGWARAKSLRLLGDHQFARGDYKKAADFYQQALKFDNSSIYKHLHALSAAADGRTDAAREIWAAIAGDSADGMCAEAAAMLAQIGASGHQPAVSADKPAVPVSQQTVVPTDKPAASVSHQPAVSADKTVALVSQQSVVSTDKPAISAGHQPAVSADKPAAPVSQQTAVPADKPAASVHHQPAISADKPAAPVSQPTAVAANKPAASVSDKFFTIQVGSFGSKENADNLVKKLTGTYSDITISTATSGDQKTLYRVRVGTFRNRDDAAAVADKIKDSGMTAMIVEK